MGDWGGQAAKRLTGCRTRCREATLGLLLFGWGKGKVNLPDLQPALNETE